MQWHPIFASLLLPLMQNFYEVLTDLPVGDLPRQADIVLLRRTAPAPFVGIWRYLTPWNVLEFKGPTDDPALRDLDLLAEVGLGIDRRLNEERRQKRQPLLEREEVSWWFLANHVGSRFRAEAERLFGGETQLGEGLWRYAALGRTLLLVSRDGLPVDRESVPLHLVTAEPLEREKALAREVAHQPGFWELYGPWLAHLHANVLEEARQMVRSLGTEPSMDLRPLIEMVGAKEVLNQMGVQKVVELVGPEQLVELIGPKQFVELVGLEKLIEILTPEEVEKLKQLLS